MAPRRSLLRFLRIGGSHRRHWRSPLLITAREPKPLEPGQPSLSDLSDEILMLIIGHLQNISPSSVLVLASVSSFLYGKARYVQHRDVAISLKVDRIENEIAYLNYLSSTNMLPAIRTLRFDARLDIPEKGYQFPLLDLVNQMTGLRDVYWDPFWYPVPESLLQNLKQHPRARLHASIYSSCRMGRTPEVAIQKISTLTACLNLYSLRVQIEWTTAKRCLKTVVPLKELVLSCPNLRKLSLDIYTPRDGCVRYGPQEEYCGLGFQNGERLPPLEELDIADYPWGRKYEMLPGRSTWKYGVIGQPEKGDEEDYWAQYFDWSRLRRLSTQDASLAGRITQKLTALDGISFLPDFKFQNVYIEQERAMVRFLEDVPSTLDSITVPDFTVLSATPIIRHGSRLRKLEILTIPDKGHRADGMASNENLTILREGLPQLEELAIGIVKSRDDWPYDTLDILASFPRLRSVKLTFEFTKPESDVEAPTLPHLTIASAESLCHYMRDHSTAKPPSLQRLHLCSNGFFNNCRDWAEANSTSLLCEVGWANTDSEKEVTVTCTNLSKELNEKMRRIIKGVETPSPAEMSKIAFKVALDGPLSMSQLRVMWATDPPPFYGFGF